MNYAKRLGALILAILMVVGAMPALVMAEEEVFDDLSIHGTFAVEMGGTVYAALVTGNEGMGLFAIPTDGSELTQLDSGSDISDLVYANGFIYYLRFKDSDHHVMRVDSEGNVAAMAEFETGFEPSNLSWYDDVLYCIVDERLYIVSPDGSGDSQLLCEELVDDYVIINSVIYYAAASDPYTYEKAVTGQEETVRQTSGSLWSMTILGTGPEKLLEKGVSNLSYYGGYLFMHNLEDNYVMADSNGNMWLEGKLYRYNIETAQMASMNLPYDWDYYPTAKGVVVFTESDVSLYPLTGGEATSLMTTAKQASVTANDDYAYVYEYTGGGKLTKLPLDGSEPIVLTDESDVLPSVDDEPTDDAQLVDASADGEDENWEDAGDGEDIEDQTYDDEGETTSSGTNSSYIFPNSSKKKLTRKQVLAINKSLWGYARNEIYARHGYQFNKSKYKSYFSKKSWYKPGGFSTSKLNSIEWYNMELIKDLEQEYGLLDGTSSSSSGSSNSSAKNNSYVLKEASSKKLTKKYLRNKLGSKSKYALARNEILARHGYVFKTAKYKKYFGNQKWYKPGGYSSGKLSNTEWHNIELLKELERE